jgi:hypothetical protein
MVLITLLLVSRLGLPLISPNFTLYGLLGGFGLSFAIFLWWLLFSRAPWIERISAIVLMAVGVFGAMRVADVSLAKGAPINLLLLLSIPPLAVSLVGWAAFTPHFSNGVRRATMAATILLACGVWTLVRTGGVTATFNNDLHWRWTPTPEARVIAESPKPPPATLAPVAATSEKAPEIKPARKDAIAAPKAEAKALWPGFRGPLRDGVVHGVRIKTD